MMNLAVAVDVTHGVYELAENHFWISAGIIVPIVRVEAVVGVARPAVEFIE